jgi:hypothetical protein
MYTVWIQLSGLHEEIEYHYLHDKTEILFGTFQFLVNMEEVIVERDIYSDREDSIALLWKSHPKSSSTSI